MLFQESGCLCLADHDAVVAVEPIHWNHQVGRRRSITEDSPGQVKFRGMAGAQKLAADTGSVAQLWRTALMGALPDGDEDIGVQRTMAIAAVCGLQRMLAVWVDEFTFVIGQRADFLSRSAQNP